VSSSILEGGIKKEVRMPEEHVEEFVKSIIPRDDGTFDIVTNRAKYYGCYFTGASRNFDSDEVQEETVPMRVSYLE
jgi:hypothetical protein